MLFTRHHKRRTQEVLLSKLNDMTNVHSTLTTSAQSTLVCVMLEDLGLSRRYQNAFVTLAGCVVDDKILRIHCTALNPTKVVF